jgi:hypothetical protein
MCALALAAYVRQSKNIEAEVQLAEIRLRAERKAGQLLSGIEGAAASGTNRGATLSYATTASKKTLPEYGITREEAASGFLSRFGLLSSMPKCSE